MGSGAHGLERLVPTPPSKAADEKARRTGTSVAKMEVVQFKGYA